MTGIAIVQFEHDFVRLTRRVHRQFALLREGIRLAQQLQSGRDFGRSRADDLGGRADGFARSALGDGVVGDGLAHRRLVQLRVDEQRTCRLAGCCQHRERAFELRQRVVIPAESTRMPATGSNAAER